MPKNIYLPKENIPKVEEVREIENTEQQQKPTITESIKEAVLPVAHASDKDEKQKEGAKKAIGYTLAGIDYVNPPAGATVSGATILGGGIEEGIGNLIGNEEMAEGGKAIRESSTQPLKDAGDAVKDVGKSIKKVFE